MEVRFQRILPGIDLSGYLWAWRQRPEQILFSIVRLLHDQGTEQEPIYPGASAEKFH